MKYRRYIIVSASSLFATLTWIIALQWVPHFPPNACYEMWLNVRCYMYLNELIGWGGLVAGTILAMVVMRQTAVTKWAAIAVFGSGLSAVFFIFLPIYWYVLPIVVVFCYLLATIVVQKAIH